MQAKGKPKNVLVIKLGILGVASGSIENLVVNKNNVILIRPIRAKNKK